jgi:very-short-patch-repair endonuclease
MGDGDLAVAKRAAKQWGVVSRRQALEHLAPSQVDRRLNDGAWVQVFPGVYRLAGAVEAWEQSYQALTLYLGDTFAFSHRSAGLLHRLRDPPAKLEIISTLHVRLEGVVAHRVRSLPCEHLTSAQGFPVTDVPTTLVHLAAVVPPAALRRAADLALQRKRTSVEALSRALAEAGRGRGVVNLRALLARYQGGDGPAESELEQRVVDVLESAGIPRPVRQRVVQVEGRVRRLDLLFPAERVVIEADGYATHSSPEAFEADRQRNNALLARGMRVLHWTWAALHERPRSLVDQLRVVLASPVPTDRP